MKRIFTILLFLMWKPSLSQVCTEPTVVKSTSLTYYTYPTSEAILYNYRFFYKVILECGEDPNKSYDNRNPSDYPGWYVPAVDALHVLDPSEPVKDLTQPNGPMFTYSWQLDSIKNISGQVDPCVVLSKAPCYSIYYYHTDVNSPNVTKPFVAVMVNCCRPFNSANLDFRPLYWGDYCYPFTIPGSVSNGIVNFVVMPALISNTSNSSPILISNDTILNACINYPFTYKIHAYDPDNDSIAYHFGAPRTFNLKLTPAPPHLPEVLVTMYKTFPKIDFKPGYTEQSPAGPSVTLDPVTGLLSGNMTDTGTLDLTMYAVEYRNGKLLDSISQDLYIKAYDCNIMTKPKALLPDSINNCDGFTQTFPNNSIPQYPNVNFNPTKVLWNFGDGDSSTDFRPVHTYADTGTYHVRLIVFPGLHCADTTTALAVVYPFVHADFSYSDSCVAEPLLIFNNSTSTSGKITSNLWQVFRDSTEIYQSSDQNARIKFTDAPQSYQIVLKVRNDKGCASSNSRWVNIENSPAPLTFHDTLLANGASLQLQANDGNFNLAGEFIWAPSYGLSDPFIADPVLNSTIDNTYSVFIKNRYGCSLQDSFHVKYYAGPSIYVPNAFSPNGDGKNDVFKPTYIGISNLKYFRVFTRYGQMVFETREQLKGWDGNLHGIPASEGAYVWEVSGMDSNGIWQNKKGTVYLIK